MKNKIVPKNALIIANGEQCSNKLIDKFLKNNQTIIVLDGAIDRVTKLGINFNILSGDFDRISVAHHKLNLPENVEIIYTPDQNKTDLEKAIEFLIKKKYDYIDIIWATGLRSDHTFNNIITLGKYFNKIKCSIHDDYSTIFALPKKFEKEYSKGDVISLFPLGKVSGITTSGLLYEMKNKTLNIPTQTGSSNESAVKGIVKIEYKTGVLIIMECTD